MFGHLTVSYSGNTITTSYDGETNSFGYRVVSCGSDFVAMRVDKGLDKDRRIHLRFVEGGSAYWIDLGPLSLGIEEKFDRLTTESGTPQR